jgi:uncharacterized protein
MNVGYRTITVGDACYLYDTATNAIVRAPAAVDAVLKDYLRVGSRGVLRKFAGRLPAEDLEEAVDFLRSSRSCRMLQPIRRLDYLPFTRAANLRALYGTGLIVMTLAVTEQCNQRCLYCPFGAANRGARRHARMSWVTARQSIDYLLSHADQHAAPAIDLFGGEPLLNWPVVEQAVTYIRHGLRRSDVEILLYTNATLLDRSKLEFLMANRVILQVSLDGPAHVHDKARVDGRAIGTHARVLRVLNWIRRRNPRYYRKCVRLQWTFRPESDLLEVFRYFSRPMFRDVQIGFAYRSGGASTIERIHHEAQLDELVERYLAALGERRPFHRALFAQILGVGFRALEQRTVGRHAGEPQPNGACFPGHPMVFVAPDGTLHPCCKYTRAGSDIGHLPGGIDVDKAQALLQAYARLCNRMCQGCWAWRLCSHCFLQAVDDDGRWSQTRKERACKDERQRIARALRRYVYIWHNEPAWTSRVKDTLHYGVARQTARSSSSRGRTATER